MLVSNNAPNCLDAAVCVLAVLLGAAVPRAAAAPLPVRGVHPGRGPGHPIPSPDSRLDHLTHRWALTGDWGHGINYFIFLLFIVGILITIRRIVSIQHSYYVDK